MHHHHPLLIALLLSTTATLVASVPTDCASPSVKDKAVKCVNQLTPMFEKMGQIRAQGVVSQNLTRELNDLCAVSLDCFKTLQACAGIDTLLILNMEGVCDLYSFISGKFKDCTQKLENAKNNDKCVTDFLLNPVYTDAPNAKARCTSLKTDGKCLKKRAQTVCSKSSADDFEDHLDNQLKRYSC